MCEIEVHIGNNCSDPFMMIATEEVEKRLEAGNAKLAPQEWTCGDRARLVHLIAPFGGAERIQEELGRVIFPP